MLDPAFTPSRLRGPAQPHPTVDITRALELGTWQVVASLGRWMTGTLWLRLTWRLTPEASARRLTRLLQVLGGLWIKAGQLLAMRVDLFSPQLCRELSGLQAQGTAAPADVARAIVVDDLGPIDSIFEVFEDEPFAVTWISQIHRARLRREQIWVAVKIQRPGVARTFARDLRIMRWLLRVIRRLHIYRNVRWDHALEELEQIAREEADFRFEAAAINRMRGNLPRRKIAVPEVLSGYCRSRVLVTEFIHAALMSDLIRLNVRDPEHVAAWLAENQIEPRVLARRLILSFLRQLFEDNFYHGDLYPGNIVLLRGSRVALLHFGACSFTEREYLVRLQLFFRALATRDYAKAADLALLLCGQLPVIAVEDVKDELVRGLRAWASRTFVKGLPYHEKSIDNATVVVTQILFKHGCPMDWAFLRVRRALTILDASLVHLDPDINYTKLCAVYFRNAERRSLTRALGRPLAARAVGGMVKALDMQDRLAEYSMFQGGLIRRHAQVFQGATDKLSDLVAAVLGQAGIVLFAAALFLGAAMIEQQSPGSLEPLVGTQLGELLRRVPPLGQAVWLLVLAAVISAWWTVRRLRRRFRQKDVRLPGTQASV